MSKSNSFQEEYDHAIATMRFTAEDEKRGDDPPPLTDEDEAMLTEAWREAAQELAAQPEAA